MNDGSGRSAWWLAFAAVLVLTALYVARRDFPGLYQGFRDSEAQVQALETRLRDLQTQTAHLEERVAGLSGDSLELEAAIRSGKRLVREGETIYRIELPDDRPAG